MLHVYSEEEVEQNWEELTSVESVASTRLCASPYNKQRVYPANAKWKHTREPKGMKRDGLIPTRVPDKNHKAKSRNKTENK